MATSILFSYPGPHPSLSNNRVRGGVLSLPKNRVWGECCDFPYENIGFDTPCSEGGILVSYHKGAQ